MAYKHLVDIWHMKCLVEVCGAAGHSLYRNTVKYMLLGFWKDSFFKKCTRSCFDYEVTTDLEGLVSTVQ